MSLFPAIESFLTVQGSKYISPQICRELRCEIMPDLKARGQAVGRSHELLVRDSQAFILS